MRPRNHRFVVAGAVALLALAALVSACRVTETPAVSATLGPSPVADTPLVSGTPPPQPAPKTSYPGPPASTPLRPGVRPAGPAPTTPYPGPSADIPPAPTIALAGTITPRPAQAVAAPAPTRGEVAFTLSIVHSGETQGEVLPCGCRPPKGGVARRATAIQQQREQAPGEVLVLDSGNTLFGKPQALEGAMPIAAMNAMGYQAMAVGEVDLGAPLPALRELFGQARFALLSANLQQGPTGTLPLAPYLLLPFPNYTVAIIGVTAPAATARAATVGLPLQVADPTTAVQEAVSQVQGQAQVIIVLSNLTMAENVALARTVPGIDAVIGGRGVGGAMRPTEVAGSAGPVVLHAAGQQGQYLGVLTLRLDRLGRVVTYQGGVILLTADYADDPAIVELLGQYGLQPD